MRTRTDWKIAAGMVAPYLLAIVLIILIKTVH